MSTIKEGNQAVGDGLENLMSGAWRVMYEWFEGLRSDRISFGLPSVLVTRAILTDPQFAIVFGMQKTLEKC